MNYFQERTGVDCVPGAENLTFSHGDTAECHAEPPTCGCVIEENPHGLVLIQGTGRSREWTCRCGKQGVTTQAFEGENLARKARNNHRQHVKREQGR